MYIYGQGGRSDAKLDSIMVRLCLWQQSASLFDGDNFYWSKSNSMGLKGEEIIVSFTSKSHVKDNLIAKLIGVSKPLICLLVLIYMNLSCLKRVC